MALRTRFGLCLRWLEVLAGATAAVGAVRPAALAPAPFGPAPPPFAAPPVGPVPTPASVRAVALPACGSCAVAPCAARATALLLRARGGRFGRATCSPGPTVAAPAPAPSPAPSPAPAPAPASAAAVCAAPRVKSAALLRTLGGFFAAGSFRGTAVRAAHATRAGSGSAPVESCPSCSVTPATCAPRPPLPPPPPPPGAARRAPPGAARCRSGPDGTVARARGRRAGLRGSHAPPGPRAPAGCARSARWPLSGALGVAATGTPVSVRRAGHGKAAQVDESGLRFLHRCTGLLLRDTGGIGL
jgi:hypothetical protein